MSDALITRSSTKAASRAVMVLSTLRFETDLFLCRLASQLVSNHLAYYRHASLPNDGLRQNQPSYRADQSPSDPTGSLFVHSD
jgi:hypothetical protein